MCRCVCTSTQAGERVGQFTQHSFFSLFPLPLSLLPSLPCSHKPHSPRERSCLAVHRDTLRSSGNRRREERQKRENERRRESVTFTFVVVAVTERRTRERKRERGRRQTSVSLKTAPQLFRESQEDFVSNVHLVRATCVCACECVCM